MVVISHKYEDFLFTDTSKNDCFTKGLEVIKLFIVFILGLWYIKQEVLGGRAVIFHDLKFFK